MDLIYAYASSSSFQAVCLQSFIYQWYSSQKAEQLLGLTLEAHGTKDCYNGVIQQDLLKLHTGESSPLPNEVSPCK